MVTLRELEARRYLSPQARAWLNNAVIELNWSVRSAKSDRTLEWVYATVDLPSGKRYEFLAGALPKSSRYLRAR